MATENNKADNRLFVLNGHPAKTSISQNIVQAYIEGARQQGFGVREAHLHDLKFDMDFEYGGYSKVKPLEPALEEVLQNIEWSTRFVVVTPMWWGGLPAKLKGLIDRVFLPGRVFDTRGAKGGLPKPLLVGRSAHVIITSDSPWWYFLFWLHRPLYWQLRRQIFGFVGFKPVRVTHFTGASHPKPGQVDSWLKQARNLGGQRL